MADRPDRREFLGISAGAAAGALVSGSAKRAAATQAAGTAPVSGRPIRLGFVGVGDRGSYHLDIALGIEDVEVPAVCDINPEKLHRAKGWVEKSGRPTPRLYGKTRTDFERLCAEEDLDCVICSTSWKEHAAIILSSMRNGKNCVSEVPLMQTLDEAGESGETHESTGKWGTLGFKSVNSALTNMVHHDVLGDIVHCEGGYVHDLRLVKFDPERERWRLQHSVELAPADAGAPRGAHHRLRRLRLGDVERDHPAQPAVGRQQQPARGVPRLHPRQVEGASSGGGRLRAGAA